jgi:hypothetical protein
MAYRAPRYSYVHAGREVGASAITVSDTAHADFPKDNLIDDRAATLFKWSASVTNPTIDFDLDPTASASWETGLARLIIPANHNIVSIRVMQDTEETFGTPNTLLAYTETVAGEQIDLGFTASAQQFIRVQIQGSAQYYLPQPYLTKVMTLSTGVALADSLDGKIDNVTRLERNNGQSPTIQHGPQQRVIEYEYESPLEGADLTAMEALVNAVGMVRPFYVDPAEFHATPGTDEPALCMKFAEMPQSRNSILVPMNGARSKVYRLRLIESLD